MTVDNLPQFVKKTKPHAQSTTCCYYVYGYRRLYPFDAGINSHPDAVGRLVWLGDLGFHNGYTLVMHRQRIIGLGYDPADMSISMLADISEDLTIGGDPEAFTRSDCLPGMKKTYDMQFKEQVPERSHEALYDRLLIPQERKRYTSARQLDIIVGFTTDTQLLDSTFVQLRDDKHFFIKYFGGGLIRKTALDKFRRNQLDRAFATLQNCFRDPGETSHQHADERMRKLIQQVESVRDENGERLITMENLRADQHPKAGQELRRIVREWLRDRGVI